VKEAALLLTIIEVVEVVIALVENEDAIV